MTAMIAAHRRLEMVSENTEGAKASPPASLAPAVSLVPTEL